MASARGWRRAAGPSGRDDGAIRRGLLASLVGDLLGAAVAAADDFLVLHGLVGDDVERVALHAFLLQLRVDLGLELLAGLSLRRRLRLGLRRSLSLGERER